MGGGSGIGGFQAMAQVGVFQVLEFSVALFEGDQPPIGGREIAHSERMGFLAPHEAPDAARGATVQEGQVWLSTQNGNIQLEPVTWQQTNT